jgi:hypothetical protein
MGQESLTCFDQPKKSKNRTKKKLWKCTYHNLKPTDNKIINNKNLDTKKQGNQHERKPAENAAAPAVLRKPIIITKMSLKLFFIAFNYGNFFFHVIKKSFWWL